MTPRWSLLPLLFLGGCIFQNVSAAELLRDHVEQLNVGARWGRTDLSTEVVAPAYLRAYILTHAEWGREVQLADVELVAIQLDGDREGATSTVSFSWYRYDSMELRQTVLRQRWLLGADRVFRLESESVADGDPALLQDLPAEEARALAVGQL